MVLGSVLALILSVLATVVPDSNAALIAKITNSSNSAETADYFTCSAAITASTPGFYYRLDETGTTTVATDSSANKRNGVYNGTVTKGATKACPRDDGSAVTFNGSTGYIDYATQLSSSTTYSSEAWLKTATTSGGLIVGLGAAATGASSTVDRVLYMTSNGRLALGVNTTSKTAAITTSSFNDNKWHHVMATAGTDGLRLYVDGTQAASSTTTIATSYSGNLRVGYDSLTGWPSAPASNFFAGTLDEVAVYGKTLTAADADSHYRAGTS